MPLDTTQSGADRICHGKVTRALRQAGGVQFLSLLPGAAHVIYSEAALGQTKKLIKVPHCPVISSNYF
uniref:Uncharacterized protein n=1 Tax=Amphiprion ocellaris TaxID=80972 RepID=A0AAQ5XPN6_AMPOC